jgi:hypothetical protein
VASRKSYLATDELASYEKIGKEFSGHGSVNHSADEYVRLGGFIHVNTAECRFSLMKRAVFGTHHSISEAHLLRYLAEWDFKSGTPAILPMANVLRSPSKVLRAGVSRIVNIVKPHTLRQRAKSFLRWRKRMMTMADNVNILVLKIESDGSGSRQHLIVTVRVNAPFLNFELEIQVGNTGNPQQALEDARQKLLNLGNGIAKAADHPLAM